MRSTWPLIQGWFALVSQSVRDEFHQPDFVHRPWRGLTFAAGSADVVLWFLQSLTIRVGEALNLSPLKIKL